MEPYEQQPDIALIAACRRGNELAFNALYQRYRLQLFAYLHKLLPGNNPLIDDFFQLTWGKATRNFDKYKHQEKFLAWLCRIAHNIVMDHFRKTNGTSFEELDEQHASDNINIEQQLDNDAFDSDLQNALQQLPQHQLRVIQMRLAGKSFKEIADAEGANINTVLGRMHYAILKLRELLNDYI